MDGQPRAIELDAARERALELFLGLGPRSSLFEVELRHPRIFFTEPVELGRSRSDGIAELFLVDLGDDLAGVDDRSDRDQYLAQPPGCRRRHLQEGLGTLRVLRQQDSATIDLERHLVPAGKCPERSEDQERRRQEEPTAQRYNPHCHVELFERLDRPVLDQGALRRATTGCPSLLDLKARRA